MKHAWFALLLVACKGTPSTDQAAPAASASPVVASSAGAVASAAPAKAWYEGAWQGTYKAELLRLETAAGGVKKWKDDDGSTASGEGKLSIQAAADGTVSGSASGPLGEHTVAGKVEGDRVALSLIPAQAEGFRGVILASQQGEGIQGTLNVATGDSLTARKASVTLARAGK
jgi:hypothetical protein